MRTTEWAGLATGLLTNPITYVAVAVMIWVGKRYIAARVTPSFGGWMDPVVMEWINMSPEGRRAARAEYQMLLRQAQKRLLLTWLRNRIAFSLLFVLVWTTSLAGFSVTPRTWPILVRLAVGAAVFVFTFWIGSTNDRLEQFVRRWKHEEQQILQEVAGHSATLRGFDEMNQDLKLGSD